MKDLRRDPGLVACLEKFDSLSVSAYREAVRLHVFYSGSRFAVRSHASKEQADRWRSAAHRILQAAHNNLQKVA